MTDVKLDDSSPRTVRRLNADWLFRRGAVGNGYERCVDDREWEQVQLPHDAAIGCNSFRLSHNPHAPAFLDVCDEQGILCRGGRAHPQWPFPGQAETRGLPR